MTDRFSEVEAEAYVAKTCFKTGPPQAVGIELEWLLRDTRNPALPVRPAHLEAATAAGAVLRSGRLTIEPGGQLELSGDPFADPAACARAVADDLAALRAGLATRGLQLFGMGLDPVRPPRRLLDLPRYAAMERYFDRSGPDGRVMMCSTAAVQVNVDAGPERAGPGEVGFRTRWAVLHDITPVLVAAFANSPFARGRPNGARCGRQAVWAALDPGRTAPARRAGERDPRESWVSYVMSAPVLCLPCEGPDWSVPPGLSFAAWARGEGPRPPTLSDLRYHLTTLFPPVRARGHLEVRTIDAQRTDADWAAALALVWALVSDPAAADAARAAAEPLARTGVARRALVDAVADPALAAAALACFAAAAPALDRLGAAELRPVLEAYAERYPARGRCPADDALDHWRRTGSTHPGPAPVEEEAACPTT